MNNENNNEKKVYVVDGIVFESYEKALEYLESKRES